MDNSEFLRECIALAGVGLLLVGFLGWGVDAALSHEHSRSPFWRLMWSDGNHVPRDIERAGGHIFHVVNSAFAQGR